MSNWKTQIIQNTDKSISYLSLPTEFVGEIERSQIEANKGWAPDMNGLIDQRVVACPHCGRPGMNSCYGYWSFTCGAEYLSDGEKVRACSAESAS